MDLKCKYHPTESVERICASARWKSDPALCWQCMVDQAPSVKEHKEHIVKVDDFVKRIADEFKNLVKLRRQDIPKAKGEYLQLYDEGNNYLQSYEDTIELRKQWLHTLIKEILQQFAKECQRIQLILCAQYENKLKYFRSLYGSIRANVELRYGLVPLATPEEIKAQLQEISTQQGDCNAYIRELKEKLIEPLDLDRNIQFQESLTEFYHLYEISQQILQESVKKEQGDKNEKAEVKENNQNQEKEEENNQDEEEDNNQYAEKEGIQNPEVEVEQEEEEENEKKERIIPLDFMALEIARQFQDQSAVVFEEFSIGIQYRDQMLGRMQTQQSRYRDLNESLNTIFSPEKMSQSRQRLTVAQRLYEISPFKEQKENTQGNSNGKRYTESQVIVTRKASHLLQHETTFPCSQNRGITSIVVVAPGCVATGSRDKTIQITNLDGLRDEFLLTGHTDQVTALCPFQSKILVSGGGNLDSTLIVWSLTQRKPLHVMTGHQSGITSIIDLQDGHAVVSGSYDNHAIIWDVHEGTAVCALRKHTAMISCLQLSQRRDHLLTGSWDRTIGVWEFSFESKARNVKGAKYLREIKCESAVLCLQTVGERQVAYGGTGNRVVILDWVSSEIRRKLQTSQFGIQELCLNGTHLIGLGATDGTLRIWDLQSKETLEKEVIRDTEHIFINNFNTSPKMSDLGDGRLAIVNSKDSPAVFNIYQINID